MITSIFFCLKLKTENTVETYIYIYIGLISISVVYVMPKAYLQKNISGTTYSVAVEIRYHSHTICPEVDLIARTL